MLAGDIPTSAAVTGHVILWSSLSTAQTGFTHLLSLWRTCHCEEHLYILPSFTSSFIQWGWVPSPSFRRAWYSCFLKKEVKLHHSENAGMWETSMVHCSAESEGAKKNSFISPFAKVNPVAPQCYVPFPILVDNWHSHKESFWNNVVCEWEYGMLVKVKCLCAHLLLPSDLWSVRDSLATQQILPMFAENVSTSLLSVGSCVSVLMLSGHITKHFTCF